MSDLDQSLRIAEALLLVSKEAVSPEAMARYLPDGDDVDAVMAALVDRYGGRGITIARVAGGWAFRTAPDLADVLKEHRHVNRRLSRAAIETLAIIAYHQPITRAEIEEVRGVAVSKGTIDLLFEAGWVMPKGRRRTPGRPSTWGTTRTFLEHFGLDTLDDLPGIDELKAAGLLSGPNPNAVAPLRTIDVDPADPDEADDGLLLDPELEPADPAEMLDVVND